MRINDELLEDWLYLLQLKAEIPPHEIERRTENVRRGLDELEVYKLHRHEKGFDWRNVRLYGRWDGHPPVERLIQMQQLYADIVELGGSGNQYVQEELLSLIARICDERSISLSVYEVETPAFRQVGFQSLQLSNKRAEH